MREEMRRIEMSLGYHARIWSDRAGSCEHLRAASEKTYFGAVAYARKQEAFLRVLCKHFTKLWKALRDPSQDDATFAWLGKRGKQARWYMRTGTGAGAEREATDGQCADAGGDAEFMDFS